MHKILRWYLEMHPECIRTECTHTPSLKDSLANLNLLFKREVLFHIIIIIIIIYAKELRTHFARGSISETFVENKIE